MILIYRAVMTVPICEIHEKIWVATLLGKTKSRGWKASYVCDKPCRGYWGGGGGGGGLVFKAWQFRVISRREMHLHTFPDHAKFQSWIAEFPSLKFTQRLVTKGKEQNSFAERKTGECFQWKTNVFVQIETFAIFYYTHATGRRETMRKEVGDARRSRLEQVPSSVPKVKEQTDVKSSNSLKASPATGAEIPCPWLTRWKRSSCNYRHHPVCGG